MGEERPDISQKVLVHGGVPGGGITLASATWSQLFSQAWKCHVNTELTGLRLFTSTIKPS